MPGRRTRPSRLLLATAALALATTAWIAPVSAGGYFTDRDRVHADSFGNLVIQSPAGYKRIIVGMGEAASGYHATGSYYEPDPDAKVRPQARHDGGRHYAYHGCERPPMFWKGRSHMYGLPDGVIPTPARPCR